LGLIVALSSCSSDDNNPVITTVYGLWKVVEIQTAPIVGTAKRENKQ